MHSESKWSRQYGVVTVHASGVCCRLAAHSRVEDFADALTMAALMTQRATTAHAAPEVRIFSLYVGGIGLGSVIELIDRLSNLFDALDVMLKVLCPVNPAKDLAEFAGRMDATHYNLQSAHIYSQQHRDCTTTHSGFTTHQNCSSALLLPPSASSQPAGLQLPLLPPRCLLPLPLACCCSGEHPAQVRQYTCPHQSERALLWRQRLGL